VALAKNEANVKTLTGYLSDADSGVRYWGVCGLVMEDKLDAAARKALKDCLHDESHDVRAMAAWALIKAGDNQDGQSCLIQLINQRSYATLRVLNVIDWMGVDTTPYLVAIKLLKPFEPGGLDDVNEGVNSLRSYLLNPDKKPSLVARGVIAEDEAWLKKAEQHINDKKGIPYDEKVP
jgi:hypothetical protein